MFISSLLLNVSCVASPSLFGVTVKENRNVGTFSKIELDGAVEMHFTQSDTQNIVVEADSSIIHRVITEIQGEKLIIKTQKISLSQSLFKINKTPKIIIFVSAPSVSNIELSGASKFYADSLKIDGLLNIEISGASTVSTGHIEANNFNLNISGASDIESNLNIFDNVTIDISGASNAPLAVILGDRSAKGVAESRKWRQNKT